MMDLRKELARRFVVLSAEIVAWPAYFFANTYMKIADALVDKAKHFAPRTIVQLSQWATEQEEALDLLKAYEKAKGHEAACELAAEIDAKNQERYARAVPLFLRGDPETAPAEPVAATPAQLGPKGFTAMRECVEIAAEFGAYPGLGGDA